MSKETPGKIRITQVKSVIGAKPRQRATMKALGLRRIRHVVEKEDSPSVRGMIKRVESLVSVSE